MINRLPKFSAEGKTPLELLYNKTPDYSFLRVFGCLAYPCLRPYNSHKLQPRSLQCIFLGYIPSHKGYKCLYIPTNRDYISRHVRFEESTFPFSPPPQQSPEVSSPTQFTSTEFLSSPVFQSSPAVTLQQQQMLEPILQSCASPEASSHEHNNVSPLPSDLSANMQPSLPTASPEVQSQDLTLQQGHQMVTRAKAGITKPIQKLCLTASKHPLYDADFMEPTCYSKACQIPEWRNVMDNQINALLRNDTYSRWLSSAL